MSEKDVKKCPECDEELEEGFIHAPRGIYWDTKEHKIQVYTSKALISMWKWTIPRTQAWRCSRCNLIVFYY